MVVRIKEKRTRIREIGLKEEEEFQQCEKAIKKRENEIKFWEEQLEKCKKYSMFFHCTQ
jgi:hypothetical protein